MNHVPTKIVLKNSTRMSLSDRFTHVGPNVQTMRANAAVEHQLNIANKRLVQQMANRQGIPQNLVNMGHQIQPLLCTNPVRGGPGFQNNMGRGVNFQGNRGGVRPFLGNQNRGMLMQSVPGRGAMNMNMPNHAKVQGRGPPVPLMQGAVGNGGPKPLMQSFPARGMMNMGGPPQFGRVSIKSRLSLPNNTMQQRGRGGFNLGRSGKPVSLLQNMPGHGPARGLLARGNFRGNIGFRGRGMNTFNRMTGQRMSLMRGGLLQRNLRQRGGNFQRGQGRGHGVVPQQTTAKDLDNELDAYMSKSVAKLDSELDEYMAQAAK